MKLSKIIPVFMLFLGALTLASCTERKGSSSLVPSDSLPTSPSETPSTKPWTLERAKADLDKVLAQSDSTDWSFTGTIMALGAETVEMEWQYDTKSDIMHLTQGNYMDIYYHDGYLRSKENYGYKWYVYDSYEDMITKYRLPFKDFLTDKETTFRILDGGYQIDIIYNSNYYSATAIYLKNGNNYTFTLKDVETEVILNYDKAKQDVTLTLPEDWTPVVTK